MNELDITIDVRVTTPDMFRNWVWSEVKMKFVRFPKMTFRRLSNPHMKMYLMTKMGGEPESGKTTRLKLWQY